jgi:phage baseplate assembly protein W
MATATKIFTDLDLSFIPHPLTGDIVKRTNENAVKASLRNLLQTNNYERRFHPEIGTPLRQLLFKNADPLTRAMVERAITDTVRNYEPRVTLTAVDVNFSPDNNSIMIRVEFKILNTSTIQRLNLTLERTR